MARSSPDKARSKMEEVVLSPDGVFLRDMLIPEPKLSEWLLAIEPELRVAEVVSLVRLGLALKENNRLGELNDALRGTAEAAVGEFGARVGTSITQIEGVLHTAEDAIAALLQSQVSGDGSALSRDLAKVLGKFRTEIEESRTGFAKMLDPNQTNSVSARLEARLQESLGDLLTSRLQPIHGELGQLREAIASQDKIKALRERSTQKGTTYENNLLEAIQTFALPQSMLVESTGTTVGWNGSKDGDIVISYNDDPLVVVECKDAKIIDLKQLDSAIVTRKAHVGILATKTPNGPTKTMQQGTMRIIGDSKVLLVWNPEEDDPAVLAAVIGFTVLLAQRMIASGSVTGRADVAGAQKHMENLRQQMNSMKDVLHSFEAIETTAIKGRKAVIDMEAAWRNTIDQAIMCLVGGGVERE